MIKLQKVIPELFSLVTFIHPEREKLPPPFYILVYINIMIYFEQICMDSNTTSFTILVAIPLHYKQKLYSLQLIKMILIFLHIHT